MLDNDKCSDDINLLDYLEVIKKHKLLVLVIITVSVIIAVITALYSPNIYQSSAIIMPADQANGPRGVSRIAAQFGISTPTTSNASEVINLLRSNILMERVVKKNNLLPVFFKKKELEDKPENAQIWKGIRKLRGIFQVKNVQREGIIELSAEYKDPKIASDIITYMLNELTDYMSNEAKRVAETNREYLETLITKNSDPLIGQKIYSMIAHQIEISMMAEVKENFAFKILDPPKVPDKRIRPNRRKTVILAFLVSLCAGVFLSFLIEYIQNMKRRQMHEQTLRSQ